MQLTKEFEAAKARVEDEVIATVQIATKLEGRLRQAKQDTDLAQQQAQQAEQRANQVLYCILCLHIPRLHAAQFLLLLGCTLQCDALFDLSPGSMTWRMLFDTRRPIQQNCSQHKHSSSQNQQLAANQNSLSHPSHPFPLQSTYSRDRQHVDGRE